MNTSVGYLVTGLALGWVTLALGFLLYTGVRRWWRGRRYGIPIDHSVLLVEYGRKMTGALGTKALAQLLTVDVPRALQVDRVALLLPEGHQLVEVNTTGALEDSETRAADGVRMPVNHAAVRWVASGGEAQRSHQGRLRELIEQGRDDLTRTRVWVPLMRGTELRGMWLLGERSPGVGSRPMQYSPEDLRWLTALGRQAATVLEATRYAEQERRTASQMRALYRQVVVAREVERGILARELHDGLLQDLCAAARDLKALGVGGDSNGPDLGDLAIRSSDMVQTVRGLCNDLRPPLLEQDLRTALRSLVEQLDARSPAPVHIEIAAEDLRLPDHVALAVFRIAQEALHNAIQHADASEIAVRLTQYPDRLRLTVTDDGRGIAGGVEPARFVAQGHFGLAGMRERAAMIGGKLDVQTAVDYGTVVVLRLPH